MTSPGDWTHKLTHKDGGTFFARLDVDGSRMYVSDVLHNGGFVECAADNYRCEASSVWEHFSHPPYWKCIKLNKFKGNK